MIRHLLVLPDGAEIFSGDEKAAAIRTVKLTETVNQGQELVPGAVCAVTLDAEIYAKESLPVAAGDEVILFSVDDTGARQQLGVFRMEKPIRRSAGVWGLTACDRMSLLDQDVSGWLASLNGWPYRLSDFVAMVFDRCGLEWTQESIPGGDLPVAAFSAADITGRQLIRWAAELAGRFCRATPEGQAEFAWYTPCTGGAVGPSGERYYYQGSMEYGDYQVAPVEKVQLRANAMDVGAIYPDSTEALNTMALAGNLLLAGCSVEEAKAVARRLQQQFAAITYTPCKLAVPASLGIRAGEILQVLTPEGQPMTVYVMERSRTGGREELRCTGAPDRTASSAVNQQSYKALTGRVLELQTDVEGIHAENRDAAGNLAALSLTVQGMEGRVSQQEASQSGIKTQLSQLTQDAQSLQLRLQTVEENGTHRVTTQTGYTFDSQGLHIARSGHAVANRVDHTGMYVTRNGLPVLQANDQGVVAYDVTVGNYLVVGSYARFEDFMDLGDTRRTGCFFLTS